MNELMFTGLQMVGCAVMCLAAGVGIGMFGLRLIDQAQLPDCSGCEEGEEVDCPYGGRDRWLQQQRAECEGPRVVR